MSGIIYHITMLKKQVSVLPFYHHHFLLQTADCESLDVNEVAGSCLVTLDCPGITAIERYTISS